MTPYEYQELAMRTAKDMGSVKMNLIHGAMGVSSDAGELVDALKKHTIYGKDLDVTNVIEEIGDVLWFCALIANTLELNIEYIMKINILKLQNRYPEKYTDEAAIALADKSTDNNLDSPGDETPQDIKYDESNLTNCPVISCYYISKNLDLGESKIFLPEVWITEEGARRELLCSECLWVKYTDGTYELLP